MPTRSATYFVYRTPHGPVTIRTVEDGVTNVAFGDVELEGQRHPSELSNRTATELLEYFAGKRRTFDVPLAPTGSAFQQAVWDAVVALPYGEAYTTADVARALGKPESYRSVGTAVRKNPLPVLVPDHRIVGANGRPTGTGAAARLRGALLELERHTLTSETG